MATFIVLRHHVTIFVTTLTNPNNLTNDLLTLKFLYLFLEGTPVPMNLQETSPKIKSIKFVLYSGVQLPTGFSNVIQSIQLFLLINTMKTFLLILTSAQL